MNISSEIRKIKMDLEKMLKSLEGERNRVAQMRISDNKMYGVLGIDKFSNEDWMHGEYATAEEALAEARKLTREAMPLASDSSIATVYYAYDPKGKYLGGDVWHEE